MSAYQTVAVGTDGSESSFRAVDRAAEIAGNAGATLLIICAYSPERDTREGEYALGEENAFLVVGSGPADQKLGAARDRATAAGATKVETVSLQGTPAEVITRQAEKDAAELLVVGNKGLNSLSGRLLGSVPQGVTRRFAGDVMIVHTT